MSRVRVSKREDVTFNGTCPSGGTWYACPEGSKSRFVGCCGADPCSTGCSQGNIQTVSFDATLNITFPDASCGSASNFYTCSTGSDGLVVSTPFWGCCKSNPCEQQQKCPTGDLVPAFMERSEQFIAYVGATNTSSPTSSPTPAANATSTRTVVLIGGAIGGGLGLVAIIAAVIFCLYRRRRNRRQRNEVLETGPSETTPMNEKHGRHASMHSDAPPEYASPNPNSYPPSPAFPPRFEHQSQDIQELPAEYLSISHKPSRPNRLSELPVTAAPGSSTPSRLSELPASTSPTSTNQPRISELPTAGAWMAELESPQPSPRPQHAAFNPHGFRAELDSPQPSPRPQNAAYNPTGIHAELDSPQPSPAPQYAAYVSPGARNEMPSTNSEENGNRGLL